MENSTKYWLTAVAAGTALVVGLIYLTQEADAADLGGNCCTDLEERIAELEATAARKGNRKVSLTVYGQINKALMHTSGDLPSNTVITENSNAESFVGFTGQAKFGNDWYAGYTLEIGTGGYDRSLLNGVGYGPVLDGDTNDVYTRLSYAYVGGPLGTVSVGLQSQATDGIVERSTANTDAVSRALSLRPITGPQILEVAEIFDGSRANLVRYDSPVFAGAMLSASWANGSFDTDDVWDVAIKWQGEGAGFKATAGVGYREGIAVPSIGNIGSNAIGDHKALSGSASVMHVDSGLFLTAAAGKVDVANVDLTAWHLQGGIERKWSSLGATTIYGEYADSDLEILNLSYAGAGVVQHIDAAAMDLYLSARRYEVDLGGGEGDATVIIGGARVQF